MMHASSSTVILDFNSRLLAETNGFLLSGVMCQRISTRVSFRRRTLRPVHPWDRMNISIHVSARRRTAIQHLFPTPENISTHVSARRRTSFLLKFFQSMVYYNSRLRKETN